MTGRRPPYPPPPGFEPHRPSEELGGIDNPRYRPAEQRRQPQQFNQPHREPPRRRFGLGGALIAGFLGTIGLVGAGGAYLMFAAPTDLIRDQIVRQVKEQTGRDLTIAGETSLSFFPSAGISLGNVSLSAPPDMGGAPLVKMASLDVKVKLLPLLKSAIEVERLVLVRPEFDLRVDSKGRRSWDFAATGPATPSAIRIAQAPRDSTSDLPSDAEEFLRNARDGAKGSQGPLQLAALEGVVLGDVRIEDGTVRYLEQRKGGAKEVIENLNVQVRMESLKTPLTAQGTMNWKGETVRFSSSLTAPDQLMTEQPAKLVINIQSRPLTAAFDGDLQPDDAALKLQGKLDASSPSLRAVAAWTGATLPPGEGLGQFSLTGRLSTGPATISLFDADIRLDGQKATGTLAVETAGAKPKLKANLKMAELNLTPYLGALAPAAVGIPAPEAAGSPPAAAPKRQPAPNSEKQQGPSSIEELLEEPGTRVKGFTGQRGWSRDPIDLTALRDADADLRLDLGRVIYHRLEIGQSNADIALEDGKLTINLSDMQLYEGRGKGTITLDGSGPVPATASNLTFEGVSAEKFLPHAADIGWLAGIGTFKIETAAQGHNEAELIATTSGRGSFAFSNGALVGFNLPGAIRGIARGDLSGLTTSPDQKTDFSELSGSFVITNGVAHNEDLKLLSPLVRLSGQGDIRLPDQTIDYMLKPKLVASLSGQGGPANLSGLEIPVRIHGPLDAPAFEPQLDSILENPEQALDAINELGKDPDGILGQILGGTEEEKQDRKEKAKKLLDRFLGR